jgi:hypothetical protein
MQKEATVLLTVLITFPEQHNTTMELLFLVLKLYVHRLLIFPGISLFAYALDVTSHHAFFCI